MHTEHPRSDDDNDSVRIDDYAHYVHIARVDYDNLVAAINVFDDNRNDVTIDDLVLTVHNLVNNHDDTARDV